MELKWKYKTGKSKNHEILQQKLKIWNGEIIIVEANIRVVKW